MSPQNARQQRKPEWQTICTIVLQVSMWVFAAGVLWQKVDDLQKTVQELKVEMKEHFSQERHANFQPTSSTGKP